MTKRSRVYNTLFIIAVITIFVMVLSFFWDFYYGVNDDIATRNVLSGRFTGYPYPQGTQGTLTLYPITAIISGLYTLISDIDFWGYFLVASHFVCFFLIERSVMNRTEIHKILSFSLVFIIFWMIDLVNIIYFQFTTVAAVYATTGIFLLFMENSDLKNHIPSICMLVMSFCVRKGTTAMIFPFIVLAWLYKIIENREEYRKMMKRCIYYFLLFGIVCGSLFAIDVCADWRGYQDEYYQEFERLRIKAWDYHGMPDYDSYPEFYQSLGDGNGLSREEYNLINSGNLTMDFSIDAKEILSYMTQYSEYIDGWVELKYKLNLARDLFMTVFVRETVKPMVLYIGVLLLLAIIYLTVHKKWLKLMFLLGGELGIIAEAACLLFVRRMPERIWQSLLLVAVLWLLGICLTTSCSYKSSWGGGIRWRETEGYGLYSGDIVLRGDVIISFDTGNSKTAGIL